MSFVDRLTKIGERLEPDHTQPSGEYEDTNTTFYDLFRNERRQLVVKIVDDHGDISMRDLAEHIAAIEDGSEPGKVGRDGYRTVYVNLYQTHLDKLDTAGIIDYDDRAKHVTSTEHTENARALLAYIESTEVTTGE